MNFPDYRFDLSYCFLFLNRLSKNRPHIFSILRKTLSFREQYVFSS